MKISEALDFAKQRLLASQIDSASLDSRLILGYLLNYSKVELICHDDELLDKNTLAKYFDLIEKRATGYPVAYILGYKEFYGLKLKVTEDTLIPRPDTETIVEAACRLNAQGKVLDLGTGSGAIILALKAQLQDKIEAYAVDNSPKALEVAIENAKNLKLNICFIQSNWFENVPKVKFSMIVSNPPYIAQGDEHLSLTSLPFEPKSALTSGKLGLDDIQVIVSKAKDYLQEDGLLLIEHGYNQAQLVQEIFKNCGFEDICTLKDLSNQDRVTYARNCHHQNA